jgi:hypothetical protein
MGAGCTGAAWTAAEGFLGAIPFRSEVPLKGKNHRSKLPDNPNVILLQCCKKDTLLL